MEKPRCEACYQPLGESGDCVMCWTYERGRLAGIEEGRAAERADVVAWLRHGVDVLGWHDEYLCAADDIEERGEHVGAAGGKK
jgi:hypothetical protein